MVKIMLEYLSKIDKVRSINKSYRLNDRQAFILDYICEKHLSHKGCRINEIILLKTAGSPATLHAVTKELTLKPKHGGIVAESRDVTLELVVLGDQANLYISDHGKPLNMKELNGKLTILSGSVKTEHNFAPAEQFLVVTGIANLTKSSILVATITGYQGKTLNARFVYK